MVDTHGLSPGLSEKAFLAMAGAAGLDVSDATHMEELYAYVQGLLPGLRSFQALDLAEVEPPMVFIPLVE